MSLRPAARLCLTVGLLVALGLAAGPAAGAASGATAAGVVRNATTGQPLPDAEVSLVFIGAQGPEAAGRARSDARGRFAFEGLTDGRYLIQAAHQGVTYATHVVVSGGAPVELVVQVYDASGRVPLRIALLGMAVDVQPGYVRVSEVVHLQNATSQTFLGPVTLPLPRAARFVTFHQGLHAPRVEGAAILDRLIVRPGAHQVAYGYSVAGAGEVRLDRRLILPVERLELFTTAPAEVRSPRLQPSPTVTSEGKTYTRATARAVPVGDLAMAVVGVPAPRHWQAPAAAAVLAVLLAIGLVWAAVRDEREGS